METKYEKQANDFLKQTGVKIEFKFLKHGPHFDGETNHRDIYAVTISRGTRKMIIQFGQSIAESQHFIDHKTGRKYTTAGNGINSSWKITQEGLENFCKPVKGKQPTNYDILACLTKYDPGTFEDFCSEYGYDTDSRQAERTYKTVKEEFINLQTIFTDKEIEELQEIQ